MMEHIDVLPKDAKYLGSDATVNNRSVYYSPSKKKYYVAHTFPLFQKGYMVTKPLWITPRGFHLTPVKTDELNKVI
jgi:hypothetical protein